MNKEEDLSIKKAIEYFNQGINRNTKKYYISYCPITFAPRLRTRDQIV